MLCLRLFVIYTQINTSNTVYCVIFAPRIIALLHLQTVSPRLKFSQKQLFSKGDNLRHRNCQVLYSPTDNEGKTGEIKYTRIFPCIQCKVIIFGSPCDFLVRLLSYSTFCFRSILNITY